MKEIKLQEIDGFKIGQAENEIAGTGCSVILCEEGASAGVDVRGGAPATRETDLLDPVNMVEKIHAVVLSGGSAYGLDASGGVMRYLEEHHVGFDMQVCKVPIVCSACLFDLTVGEAHIRPDAEMGYQACEAAMREDVVLEGNHGAGTGASVGKVLGMNSAMKSGIGTYAIQVGDLKIGAIVAVNAVGDVIDHHTQQPLASLYDRSHNQYMLTENIMMMGLEKGMPQGNTTIGCILTNAKLTKAQAKKISSIAHNGYARSIRPVHTMSDGDTIFTMAHGNVDVMPDIVGALASDVMAEAVNRAVKQADGAYGLPAWKDIKKENV